MTQTSAFPLPPREYSQEYMSRLLRQLDAALAKLATIKPLTVGSDLTGQRAGYPLSGLTIINVPTSADDLPSGSVWSDGGVLKIKS